MGPPGPMRPLGIRGPLGPMRPREQKKHLGGMEVRYQTAAGLFKKWIFKESLFKE